MSVWSHKTAIVQGTVKRRYFKQNSQLCYTITTDAIQMMWYLNAYLHAIIISGFLANLSSLW